MALTVRDIMETDVPSVYPEDPLEKVVRTTRDFELREIARHKHNRLPVVEHGRLVGVVTRIDVLDVLTAE